MKRMTEMYCQQHQDKPGTIPWLSAFYTSVFTVRLHGDFGPIYHVRVVEDTIPRGSEHDGKYWAWWDNEDAQFMYVWPSKGQVNMCFPYGAKAEEQRGRGWLLPVEVEIISEIDRTKNLYL